MQNNYSYAPENIMTCAEFYACLTKPVLYGWYRAPDYLYIGMSQKSVRRILSHDIINCVEPILPGDEFHFWHVKSPSNILAQEAFLVQTFRPKYNSAYLSRPHVERALSAVHKCIRCKKVYNPTPTFPLICEPCQIIFDASVSCVSSLP